MSSNCLGSSLPGLTRQSSNVTPWRRDARVKPEYDGIANQARPDR